jgi:flagellin
MAITVNTNLSSIAALINVNNNQAAYNKVLGRISSGLRITAAADDAAGLAVAESLNAQTRSLEVARRNVNDGIAVIQTAEGAAAEVGNLLKRMRELAVQSSSETLATTERSYIEQEYDSLVSEVDRIAQATEFNGIALASGTGTTQIVVQIGANNTANDRITIGLGNLTSTGLTLAPATVTLGSATQAQAALGFIDAAVDRVNSYRSTFGAAQNRIESAGRGLDTYNLNLKAAESQIRDADFALEAAMLTKQQILSQSGIAVLGQANQINAGALRLIG